MWGLAVGTTVAAVAVSAAAAEDEDEDEEDEEDVDEAAAAAATPTPPTAAATSGTSGAPVQGGLPCDPLTKEHDETIYYVCGEQHFVLAYGGTGPVYVPVPAP
jgi:hypothetical protein